MRISNIVTVTTGQKIVVNSLQKMKVELYDEDGEVILRQFVKSKVCEVCKLLNFKFLPTGNYFLKLEGNEFTKFEDLEIAQ